MRAIFVIDGEGVVRHRHVSRTGAQLPVGRRPRAGGGRARLMPAGGRPVRRRRRRRRSAARWRGRGRRSCSATGSRRPAARSCTARGRCRAPGTRSSPTTPAGTASPIPPRRARVMDTRSWSPTSRRSSRRRWGRGGFVLAGHSMGAHTAVAYALRHPSGSPGWSLIGPVYTGDARDGGAGLLGRAGGGARRGRGRRLRRPTSSATRGSTPPGATRCCASPASGCSLHRHPEAVVAGAARGAALAALRVDGRARARSRSRRSSSPATTPPIPGHPYAVAAAYAERLPRARLISEAEGESPLAWQGGKLSRELADFYADALSSCDDEVSDRRQPAARDRLLRGPRDRRRHLHRDRRVGRRIAGLPGRRQRLRDGRRTAPTRTIAGINIAVFGIVGYVGLFLTAFFVNDLARFLGFAIALGGFGFSIYLTYLEIFKIEAICEWCVGQRGADDDPFPAQRHPADRLRRRGRRRGARRRAHLDPGEDRWAARGKGRGAARSDCGRNRRPEPATGGRGCCGWRRARCSSRSSLSRS